MNMSAKISVSAMLLAAVIGFSGCADYVAVGAGYGPDYYVPDYAPYYAGYYYDGSPWWGPAYVYNTRKIVVRDVDKRVNVNRNIYYGGHHFARDWRVGRTTIAPARAGGGRRNRR